MWDLAQDSAKEAVRLKTRKDRVEDIAWIPNSEVHIMSLTDRGLKVYDITKPEEESKGPSLPSGERAGTGTLSFDPRNPTTLAVVYSDEVLVSDINSGETVKVLREPFLSPRAGLCLEWFRAWNDLAIISMRGREAPWMCFMQFTDVFKRKEQIKPVRIREFTGKWASEPPQISSLSVIPNTLDVFVVLRSGRFAQFTFGLKEYPLTAINSRGEVAVSAGKSIRTMTLKAESDHITISPGPRRKGNESSLSVDVASYSENPESDMSQLTAKRAKAGYGLSVHDNAELAQRFADPDLAELWQFVSLAYSLCGVEKGPVNPLMGVYRYLQRVPGKSERESRGGYIPVYRSDVRLSLLRCLGWVNMLGPSMALDVRKAAKTHRIGVVPEAGVKGRRMQGGGDRGVPLRFRQGSGLREEGRRSGQRDRHGGWSSCSLVHRRGCGFPGLRRDEGDLPDLVTEGLEHLHSAALCVP